MMRSALGLLGLLIVLVMGYTIYTSQIQLVSNGKPLKQQINLAEVRSDLLSLAQAERIYLAANGAYATLGQLRNSKIMSSLPAGNRAGYEYSLEVDGTEHFQITASPADSSREDLPTLSINETMQISQ